MLACLKRPFALTRRQVPQEENELLSFDHRLPASVQKVIDKMQRSYYDWRMTGEFSVHPAGSYVKSRGVVTTYVLAGSIKKADEHGRFIGSDSVIIEIDACFKSILKLRRCIAGRRSAHSYHAVPASLPLQSCIETAIRSRKDHTGEVLSGLVGRQVTIVEADLIRHRDHNMDSVCIEGVATLDRTAMVEGAHGYGNFEYFKFPSREVRFLVEVREMSLGSVHLTFVRAE